MQGWGNLTIMHPSIINSTAFYFKSVFANVTAWSNVRSRRGSTKSTVVSTNLLNTQHKARHVISVALRCVHFSKAPPYHAEKRPDDHMRYPLSAVEMVSGQYLDFGCFVSGDFQRVQDFASREHVWAAEQQRYATDNFG